MMTTLEYVGWSDAGDVYRYQAGTLYVVGHDSPVEDWVLAKAPCGIAASRRWCLEAAALEAAVELGHLIREFAGMEGYSSECRPQQTERLALGTAGDQPYWHGGHLYRWERYSYQCPIQGRGPVTLAHYRLQLLPTAVRLGRIVIYAEGGER